MFTCLLSGHLHFQCLVIITESAVNIYVEAYIFSGKYLGVGQQDCMISMCLTVGQQDCMISMCLTV